MKQIDLPNQKHPCKDCPFRKDILQGWLGADRMEEILEQKSFTCHKTQKSLQCAGHMIIKGEENEFVRMANELGIGLQMKGHELIFTTKADCIKHHK